MVVVQLGRYSPDPRGRGVCAQSQPLSHSLRDPGELLGTGAQGGRRILERQTSEGPAHHLPESCCHV